MKLIRDRLADVSWDLLPEGREFVRPVKDLAEHLSLLRRKILEAKQRKYEQRGGFRKGTVWDI